MVCIPIHLRVDLKRNVTRMSARRNQRAGRKRRAPLVGEICDSGKFSYWLYSSQRSSLGLAEPEHLIRFTPMTKCYDVGLWSGLVGHCSSIA